MNLSAGMYGLKGIVQHYSWGGFDFIPSLIGENNPELKPYAEYWLGAHPNHPALVLPEGTPLDQWIGSAPEQLLGAQVAQTFGGLPYLLKVLDVRQMLSIQVHPCREGAEKGYAAESQKNIPVHAAHRNYKDPNAKPEMMVALGDFWLLHGFKNSLNMGMIFEATPELAPLRKTFDEKGLQALYEEVMGMDESRVEELLLPLMERIIPLYESGELEKDEEDFWAARAALTFCADGHLDRGIFSIYLFNLVYLRKGEGLFQPEGLPHAYLEGQNIEVMANSDNVLRAGLTTKHVDTSELMKHIRFESTTPAIINRKAREQRSFETPAEEFELFQIELDEDRTLEVTTGSAEIFLVMEGKVQMENGKVQMQLGKGQAVLATAGQALRLKALEAVTVFRVGVPEVAKNKSD